MESLVFLLAVSCLVSFQWGRKCFFKHSISESNFRRGLKPFGTIFGFLSLAALFPGFNFIPDWMSGISMSLFLVSLSLFWLAVREFSEIRPSIAFSTAGPTSLVCSGPYRWVRHPFYLAYIIFWIGCLVAVPGLLSICAFTVMTYLYVTAARLEESNFILSSGCDEYLAYSNRAGMFVPKFLPKLNIRKGAAKSP